MAEERADRDLADEGFPRASSVPRWIDNLVALGWRVLVVVGLAVVLWYLAMLMWTAVASVVVAVIVEGGFEILGVQQQGALGLGGQRLRHRTGFDQLFNLEFQAGFSQPQVVDSELGGALAGLTVF